MKFFNKCGWSHFLFWQIVLLFLFETIFFSSLSTTMDMTEVWQILLLSISSSLDNLGVGLALGLAGRKITNCINCYLSFLNGFCMFITMIFGTKANRYIDEAWARRASGMIFILLGVAAVFLEDPGGSAESEDIAYHEVEIHDLDSNPRDIELVPFPSKSNQTINAAIPIDQISKGKESDEESSNTTLEMERIRVSRKHTCFQRFCGAEICAIAVSVSVSNLAAGFGAGLINLSIPALCISVHVASFVTMLIGNAGGVWARQWLNVVVLQYIAGALLVILGLSGFYEDIVIPLPSIDD